SIRPLLRSCFTQGRTGFRHPPRARRRATPQGETTMRIRKSLLAVAVVLGVGLTAPAWPQDQTETGRGDNNSSNTEDNGAGNYRDNDGESYAEGPSSASANNNSSATTSLTSSFNKI